MLEHLGRLADDCLVELPKIRDRGGVVQRPDILLQGLAIAAGAVRRFAEDLQDLPDRILDFLAGLLDVGGLIGEAEMGLVKFLVLCRRQRLATVDQRIDRLRSEEHTSELQSLMRSSYAVFCLKKKKKPQ